jgi:hypothetical protein
VTSVDTVARVFNPRRGRAHLLDSAADLLVTYCGIWMPEGWHGTGSQDEETEAYRRRLCDRCYRRAVWRKAA